MKELSNAISWILLGLALVVIMAILSLRYSSHSGSEGFTWNFKTEPMAPPTQIPTAEGPYSNLVEGNHKAVVERHCLGCHSAKLIVQNRMTKEKWNETITWMQETQGLWNLGKDHHLVVDYLATNYGPIHEGRRKNLDVQQIEWYVLAKD